MIFSDEAHFHLSGSVNKQTCRFWGTTNPRIIAENPLYPPNVTVWCGIWANGVVGPYFFENDDENALTVSYKRYRDVISEFLWPKLEGMDLGNISIQQDGVLLNTRSNIQYVFKLNSFSEKYTRSLQGILLKMQVFFCTNGSRDV